MSLTDKEVKAIKDLVREFKNILPRMGYQLLEETAQSCATLCVNKSLEIIEQERIKAKKLFLEIINDEPAGGFDNGYHKLKNIARKYLDEYQKTQS